jgi:acetyltransferase-like isoleucine patch superfamily enzyme
MPKLPQAFNTPWKIKNRIFSWLVHPYIRLVFALNGIAWGENWRFFGVPVLQKHRLSRMKFGNGMQLRSTVRSNPLGPNHPAMLVTWKEGAVLDIGENFAMSGGALCAFERITIGNNVAIGANTTIADTDFHPLEAEQRYLDSAEVRSAPVVIEDGVFIGMNCLILKGVTIGRGSVIGAGSVVTKDIAPGVIAAGNPARVLREL